MGWKHLQMDFVGGECEWKQNESWVSRLLKGKTINQVLLSCPSRKMKFKLLRTVSDAMNSDWGWLRLKKNPWENLIKNGTQLWDGFGVDWTEKSWLNLSRAQSCFMEVVNNAGVNKFSHAWFNKNLNLNGNHQKKRKAEDWKQKYIALWYRRGKWCVIFPGSVKRRNQERQKMKT